jgi:CRP/FNR family transcriptional regulator, dissimilatory nitrate respiration regulator
MCRGCTEDPSLALQCRSLREETLRRVYLFEDLPLALLDQVLDRMRETTLGPDQWLYFCGDPARSFYLIQEGEMALLRHTEEGDEFIVAIVGPGELVAEDLVFLEEPRHLLSARTLGSCQVAEFDGRQFHRFLDDEPALLHKLLHTLHRRNAMLLDEIERVTVRSATERLMAFLESQAARGASAPQRIPKRVLASRLSIRPETLSRLLGRLKACRRLEEADGCLVLAGSEEGTCVECEVCPGRVWGCPGPRRSVTTHAGPATVTTEADTAGPRSAAQIARLPGRGRDSASR